MNDIEKKILEEIATGEYKHKQRYDETIQRLKKRGYVIHQRGFWMITPLGEDQLDVQ